MRWVAATTVVLVAGFSASASGTASVPFGACRLSRFTAELGPLVTEPTGQHTITVRLVNRTWGACVLDGYPRVVARGGADVIPFAITHRGDQMVTSRRPARVVVRPRGSAFVALNHYRCDLGNVRRADTLRIGSGRAGRTGTAVLKLTDRYQKLDYCGRGDPGSTLAVSPFEPTLEAALKH